MNFEKMNEGAEATQEFVLRRDLNAYRGVSKYYFPMYLKEVEYRFNHRRDNLFKLFIKVYFGYEYTNYQ